MPTREVTSAPWAPVPARACTGRAATEARPTRDRRHRAAGRVSTAPAPAEATCRGGAGVPTVRSDRRDRPDRVEHVPIPPAAPTARLDPFGSRRAPAAQELPLASAAEQGALVRIGARAAGSEGSGGRGHLSERPGWPSGAPISRGSTVSMIVFGGRRGPHRSGSRSRGRPIESREAGREGRLWPDAASQGRPPDGSGLRA